MGGCGLLRVVYSYFETGCRKNCARDNPERQGAMVSWYTYKSLYSSLSYVYGGPQLSRQNQKPHGKNKIPRGETKNLTAKQNTSWQNQKPHGKNKIPHGKTKYLAAKPNTSQQKQNSFCFAGGICFCREVFGFCCEVFGFAVRYLVLP